MVLVYLPILFPNYPPELYIEKTSNIQLNKYYKDGKISPEDLKINLDYFIKFDPNTNNISEIIDNLVINFTQNFPIYKDNNSNSALNNLSKNAKCFFDKSKAYLVQIPKIHKSYSTNFQNANNSQNLDKFSSVNFKTQSIVEVKEPFNDNTFLQYIRKQTKDIIGYNYLEYKDKFNIKGNLDNLRNLDKNIKKKENDANIYKKNAQLKSQVEALKNIKIKLIEIEKSVEQELTEQQKEVLYAIASDGYVSRITSSDFVKRHHLKSASAVQSATKRLLDLDLITEQHKSYSISDPLLRIWIVR